MNIAALSASNVGVEVTCKRRRERMGPHRTGVAVGAHLVSSSRCHPRIGLMLDMSCAIWSACCTLKNYVVIEPRLTDP